MNRVTKKKKFKFGHSIGAFFKVLQKAIHGGHVDERQVFYMPFSFSIQVHKLSVVTDKRKKVERMMKYYDMLEELE